MANSASFQKSPRRLSPGQPSGLINWMIMKPTMTKARIFVMSPLTSKIGACQSGPIGCRREIAVRFRPAPQLVRRSIAGPNSGSNSRTAVCS